MLCKYPYYRGVLGFGCGRCLPCRISRRRIWTTRIVLEWLVTGVGCFVTLTYNEDNIPRDGNLQKKDLQKFQRKLMRDVGKFRYFGCGEYGEVGKRPHYHLIIFGKFISARRCQKSWGKGRIQVGELNKHTAQYVAGYVNKKLTKEGDKYLEGKKPEFSLMSRRPGIGYGSLPVIVQGANTLCYQNHMDIEQDVPKQINFGKEAMPLGRYLREKLRKIYGYDTKEHKRQRGKKYEAVQDEKMRQEAVLAREAGRDVLQAEIEDRIQKIKKMEVRQKLFSRRNKI